MYILRDTFNDCTISRHRTLEAAVKADRAHGAMIRKANGSSSYIPTSIRNADGSELSADDASHVEYLRDKLSGMAH